MRRLRRPEARGEHMDRELDAVDARALVFPRGAEALHRVGAHLHVGEHALELGSELVAALRFELRENTRIHGEVLEKVGGDRWEKWVGGRKQIPW